MAIYTEESVTRVTNVDEYGIVHAQREDRVLRDGEVISIKYHRDTLKPGDDLTGKHPMAAAVARGVWNPENVGAMSAETLAEIAKAKAEQTAAQEELEAKQAELDAAQAATAQREAELAAKQVALQEAEIALANKRTEIAVEIVRQIGQGRPA